MLYFRVTRTSFRGVREKESKPVDGAVWNEKRKCWVLEVTGLEQLVELVERVGDLVIGLDEYLAESFDCPLIRIPFIEIYDDFRE